MIKIITDYKNELISLKKLREQQYSGEEAIAVRKIVKDVQILGDSALFEYTKKFDGIELNSSNIKVTKNEIDEAYQKVSAAELTSLRRAIKNILSFQIKLMKNNIKSAYLNKRGIMIKAVDRAGIYVPGGKASYPSSVMMCALPAVAAGVNEIYMVTPASNNINPLTLVAAKECGVNRIFKVGGAQSIAALAYGTDSIPKVDIIAGPGNIYVTLAKKEVFGAVGIDMLAGPSEILIIAEGNAQADFIASDMLSQAEHDEKASSFLITDDIALATSVQIEIEKQMKNLDRNAIASKSIDNNGKIIIVDNIMTAVSIANEIAPEHLELMVKTPKKYLPYIKNAGAVFLGAHSPEPLGDYFAGPDHVLPTSGSARFFSALSADTFIKKISLINYNKKQLNKVKDDIILLSNNEGLTAHSNSIKIRFDEE